MHFGQEIELEEDHAPIPLDIQPESVRPPSSRTPHRRAPPRKPVRRRGLVPLLLLLLLGGGAALERTPHGAFFRRDVDTFLKRDEHATLELDTMNAVHAAFAFDTWDHAVAGLAALDDALAKAPQRKTLAAFGAWTLFAYELRFGADPKRHEQALALLANGEGSWVRLATATRDVLSRDATKAMASAKLAHAGDPHNAEAHLVFAFATLLAEQPKDAIVAFDQAVGAEQTSRTRGALAAALESIDPTRAKESAALLADVAVGHVSSRLVLARLAVLAKDTPTLERRLGELAKLESAASRNEKAEIATLRGDLAMAKGSAAEAKAHYQLATADPTLLRPRLGLARAMIALGEFEAARSILDTIVDPSATAEVARLRTLASSKPTKPK